MIKKVAWVYDSSYTHTDLIKFFGVNLFSVCLSQVYMYGDQISKLIFLPLEGKN